MNSNIYLSIVSFVLSIAFIQAFLPMLYNQKYGQIERAEGPSSHKKKQGTPTMGGLPFILAFFFSIILFFIINHFNMEKLYLVLIPTFGYGIIGFIDDLLIVKQKTNEGISPLKKLALQCIVAIVFFYFYLHFGYNTTIMIGETSIDLGWLYGVLIILIMLGTTNAVNLTDGLDGLAGGLTVFSSLSFSLICYLNRDFELFACCLAMSGVLVGFLVFNINPAKIFMGNVGSLALGGFLAAIATVSKNEILLLIICLPFVIETISVILQVGYYKLTKKRLFKMAPIHHHFELAGVKEINVVLMFWMFGIICSIIGVLVVV